MLSTLINNQFKIDYSKKVLIECNNIEQYIYLKYFMCHKFSYISSYNIYRNIFVVLKELLCNVILMLFTFNQNSEDG